MKKYLILVFAVPVIYFLLIGSVYPDSAKDALMALKKLQARCQAGISYRDYSNALGEAKFPVNLFIESPEAQNYPELLNSVNKAIKHYEFAGTLWTHKISEKFGVFIATDSSLGMEINKLYPQAPMSSDPIRKGRSDYFVDRLLPIIWNEASQELDNITILYSKIGEQSVSEIDTLRKENSDLKSQIDKLEKENALLKKLPKEGR